MRVSSQRTGIGYAQSLSLISTCAHVLCIMQTALLTPDTPINKLASDPKFHCYYRTCLFGRVHLDTGHNTMSSRQQLLLGAAHTIRGLPLASDM